jgi:hypothetical protein
MDSAGVLIFLLPSAAPLWVLERPPVNARLYPTPVEVLA